MICVILRFMILPLLPEGDPSLKTAVDANPLSAADMKQTSIDLIETMLFHSALGLAANQCGVNVRAFSMNVSEPKVFFNPVITSTFKRSNGVEGCLSFPGLFLKVTRAARIMLSWEDETGEHNEQFSGMEARCIQHEIDHLNGITFDTLVGPLALALANKSR